jgi:hypothetical protein
VAGHAQAAAARISVLAAAAFGVAAVVCVRDPASRGIALALAVVAPALLLQDVRRAILVASARTRRSAAASTVVLAGQLAGGMVLERSGRVSAPALLLVWGGSAAVSMLLVRVSIDRVKGAGSVREWLAGSRRYWPRFLVEAITQSGASQLPLLLVAGIAGAGINAGLRAATLLVAPIYVLQQAVGQLIVAEAARVRPAALLRFATRGQVAFLVVSAAWLAVVVVLPRSLLTHLVGDNLGVAWLALPGIAVFAVGNLLVVPAVAVLRVGGKIRAAMLIRLMMSPLLVALPVGFAVGSRSAGRVAAGFGAFGICVTLVWTVAVRVLLRPGRPQPAHRPAQRALAGGGPDPRRPAAGRRGAGPAGGADPFIEAVQGRGGRSG